MYYLLPAIFASGIMFDRGSAFVATGISVVGTIWIIRSHQTRLEVRTWRHLLAGQPVQVIRVGHDPVLLYRYQPK